MDSSGVSRKCPLLDCVIQRESYLMITVLLRANYPANILETYSHSIVSIITELMKRNCYVWSSYFKRRASIFVQLNVDNTKHSRNPLYITFP